MSRLDAPDENRLDPSAVQAYLEARYPGAQLISLAPLGASTQEGLKSYGYGKPLRAHFLVGGVAKDVVVRTMAPDPFGHDRRADRIELCVLSEDAFVHYPRHVQALDAGVIDGRGRLVHVPRGEPYLITDYVEGELYAHDLKRLAKAERAEDRDLDRAEALAHYLAELHTEVRPAASYVRAIRDLIGHGEGIFGLVDSYPDDHPVATRARLEAFELAAVRWRNRLRRQGRRARRTHGDFHPFNILFRAGADFSVLDASRGGSGDPADDLAGLTINYLFFDLAEGRRHFDGPLRALWDTFWQTYLQTSGDKEVLEVIAPFFAWRTLVVASPVWYPNVADPVRDRLLCFAERLLAGRPFDPQHPELP